MPYIKPLLFAFILLVTTNVFAQMTELPGVIRLHRRHHIFKLVSIPDCPKMYNLPAGSTTTVTHEKKITNGKTEIKVESIIPPSSGAVTISISSDKEYKIPIPAENNERATLYLDEKDKTKLYINYFIMSQIRLLPGTTLREYTQTYNCKDSTTAPTYADMKTLTDTVFYAYRKVMPDTRETTQAWFKHSDGIEVLNSSGAVAYYLVNRYNNAKYILELDNRYYVPYTSSSFHLSALVIPIKVRFGFTRNGMKVKDDVSAAVNVGLYGGIKTSRYHITNRAGTYINNVSSSWRLGPFINLSAVTVDSVTSTVGKIPMKKEDKQTIAALSTGVGFMYEVKGAQIGAFAGWDFGMGSDASNWNYHKRFWLGLGLGYKISDLFAPKE
ncbi:hypothetical protein [Chitinophaga tropicalis]|uniref:Uncharacterized protein n=1 Tax=Chitinophaga tropicalis TaxID=2683588 RepID=A0A7K1U6S4_9BACT|nr:hypothetical protein [Chitinophaga tropicalis]MVT09675.1 hypothetical protein [Chitinophaga tropicalis]